MRIEEVVREITAEEKRREISEIPAESVELLRAMGIPEDEWKFMVGIGEEIPHRYARLKERLVKLGLQIEERREGDLSFLLINFPEDLKLEETLFLSCLSQCAVQPHKRIVINFSKNSAGTVVMGSPVPKIFSTNIARSSIEINLEEGADGDVALLYSYDLETYSESEVKVEIGKNASLKLSGVIFNPGRQLGLKWFVKMLDDSKLFFDEVSFLMSKENYRGSWSDLEIRGKNVKCEINSADFALSEGESKAVYIAKIREGGKRADVEINSYSMDFSAGARKMFLPGFYTEEDEVVLKHSAGSARFGEDKVEYMRSRGLSGKEISYLIIDTILEKTVYEKLPPEFMEEMSSYTKFIIGKMNIIV